MRRIRVRLGRSFALARLTGEKIRAIRGKRSGMGAKLSDERFFSAFPVLD